MACNNKVEMGRGRDGRCSPDDVTSFLHLPAKRLSVPIAVERNECLIYEYDNVRDMLMDVSYEVRLSQTILFFLFVLEFSAIYYCINY
jgi:hypothetical protein